MTHDEYGPAPGYVKPKGLIGLKINGVTIIDLELTGCASGPWRYTFNDYNARNIVMYEKKWLQEQNKHDLLWEYNRERLRRIRLEQQLRDVKRSEQQLKTQLREVYGYDA